MKKINCAGGALRGNTILNCFFRKLLVSVTLVAAVIIMGSFTADVANGPAVVKTVAVLPVLVNYNKNVLENVSSEESIRALERRDSKMYQREFQTYFKYLNEKKMRHNVVFQSYHVTDSLLSGATLKGDLEEDFDQLTNRLNSDYFMQITLTPNFIISSVERVAADFLFGINSIAKGQIYYRAKVMAANGGVVYDKEGSYIISADENSVDVKREIMKRIYTKMYFESPKRKRTEDPLYK